MEAAPRATGADAPSAPTPQPDAPTDEGGEPLVRVGPTTVRCGRCGAPASLGRVASSALVEISGLVASARHPGVFYAHNDSGEKARLFLLGAKGEDLGVQLVSQARAVDWEDMARGPCGEDESNGASCLYLADIGDNQRSRDDLTIYRVREPKAGSGMLPSDAFPFVYPDGPQDAETLLVHPKTGVLTVVTKALRGAAGVYEFPMPLTPGRTVTLIHRGDVKVPWLLPLVTGGDVDPASGSVLLRSYVGLALWPAQSLEASVAETLLQGLPCEMPVASEAQGEAVAFLADGSGYVTVSEGPNEELSGVSCR
jgi:hypothetical protein